MKGAKKVGEVTFRFYEKPDGTWEVATVVHQKSLPDMETQPKQFTKMAIMAAQIRDVAQKQLIALDMLLVGKQEIKEILEAEKQADTEQYQTKLPFEDSAEDIKRQEEADDWADNGFCDGEED